VTILIIVLDNSNNCIASHPAELHSMLNACPMAKATTEDVECLEAPMKRLLTILAPSQKLFEIFCMFFFCHDNFVWLPFISTICYTFLFAFELKVKSAAVPFSFVFIFLATAEYCDVMRWYLRASDRRNTRFAYREREFIL